MKKFFLCSVAALVLSIAVPSTGSAQVLPPVGCPPFCPPSPSSSSALGSGSGGAGQGFAYGIIAIATYYAILNPRRGSDSILANTIHGEWACARRDKRPRCEWFVRLSRSEQNRLRRLAGLPPH